MQQSCLLKLAKPHEQTIFGQARVDAFLQQTSPADVLEGAVMAGCAIHVSFAGRDVQNMQFDGVDGRRADFSQGAQAQHAHFSETDLSCANLSNSDFKQASFTGHSMSLRGASLDGADLDEATLADVEMEGADLAGASLSGADFHPHSLPDISYVAEARGLDHLRSMLDQTALHRLGKELEDSGLEFQSRQVILALQRGDQQLNRYRCATGYAYAKDRFPSHPLANRVAACTIFSARALVFDATCEFGLQPWRPLVIILTLGAMWTFGIAVWLRFGRTHTLSVAFTERGKAGLVVPVDRLLRASCAGHSRWAASFKIAGALTISSIFNLPFKEIEVGQWLRMISKREYEFQTRGRIRVWVGCLSLVCFYLLAISVLCFLENPFSK